MAECKDFEENVPQELAEPEFQVEVTNEDTYHAALHTIITISKPNVTNHEELKWMCKWMRITYALLLITIGKIMLFSEIWTDKDVYGAIALEWANATKYWRDWHAADNESKQLKCFEKMFNRYRRFKRSHERNQIDND